MLELNEAHHFLFLTLQNIGMMLKKWFLLFSLTIGCQLGYGQYQLHYYRITSSHTSFPDTGRSKGHLYQNILYTAAEHYSDSNVLIIVPPHFYPGKKVSMIFWFHGWNNNIDSALVKYGISRQFLQMGCNTVLVLAETAKDAPDSYGGKLEQPGTFKGLVTDVLQELVSQKVLRPPTGAGHILLAGHSGAYRVIAGILHNGQVPISEVVLFDALYANRDYFYSWLASGRHHRFINLYTDHGGTLEETHSFLQQVENSGIRADTLEESSLTASIVRKHRVLFIHSLHAHDDIIQHPDNFSLLLGQSPFLKKFRDRR